MYHLTPPSYNICSTRSGNFVLFNVVPRHLAKGFTHKHKYMEVSRKEKKRLKKNHCPTQVQSKYIPKKHLLKKITKKFMFNQNNPRTPS